MSADHLSDAPTQGSNSGHRFALRVYYEDTDAGGVVYHANYLRFAERARTEMLREAGLDHHALRSSDHGVLAVRRCEVDFLRPALLDDELLVVSTVVDSTGARLHMLQEVRRAGLVLAVVHSVLVFLGSDLRPKRLPNSVRRVSSRGSATRAP